MIKREHICKNCTYWDKDNSEVYGDCDSPDIADFFDLENDKELDKMSEMMVFNDYLKLRWNFGCIMWKEK